jgi:hypothetical protein
VEDAAPERLLSVANPALRFRLVTEAVPGFDAGRSPRNKD